jgi:glycosyltransferase involved in cell wall biosynthesis
MTTSVKPDISVVIPTLRGGAYLREAINSVLAQSFANFELIVVADGCRDDLSDLETRDARIHLILQRNRGESVARNVGIRAARSDLIAFVDDDDRMLPSRLAMQYKAMEERRDAGMCHSQFRIIDEHGAPGELGYSRDVQYLDLLRKDVRILLPTTMMRKSVIEEVGTFDSTLRTGQDLEVIYRIARDSDLVFIPEVLTEYRRHGSNASGDIYQAARNSINLLNRHLRNAELLGKPEQIAAAQFGLADARRLGAMGAIQNSRISWSHRDKLKVLKHLQAAFIMSPRYTLGDLIGNRWPVTNTRSKVISKADV